jgi:glycosyltransferase involved in cell wall biosynthesis
MNKRMEKIILFAIPDFRGGGAERVFLNLINNLSRDKFIVHVAVGKLQGEYCKYLPNDVIIHELGNTNSIKSIIPIIKLVRSLRPHAILSTLGYVVSVSLSSVFLPSNIKVISRFGNTISSFLDDVKKDSRTKYIFQFMLNKLVVYLSDIIIVQSTHMKNDLIVKFSLDDKCIDKIIKINNPVDIENLYKNVRVASLPRNIKKFIDTKKNIFVSVGRLDRQKNYKDLIQAFSIAHQSNSNIGLVILGEGSCRKELERLSNRLGVDKSVLMPGFVDNPEIVVANANCFISSSLYEGVSNAILEALSLGIPVIATNCPSGIGEVIVDGKNGFLVDLVQDLVKNLSDKILIVSEDPQEIQKMTPQEISDAIRKSFGVEIITKKYENVLQ